MDKEFQYHCEKLEKMWLYDLEVGRLTPSECRAIDYVLTALERDGKYKSLSDLSELKG